MMRGFTKKYGPKLKKSGLKDETIEALLIIKVNKAMIRLKRTTMQRVYGKKYIDRISYYRDAVVICQEEMARIK